MPFLHKPFQRALAAAGVEDVENVFTYQDYLYELLADGYGEKPVTEKQWEAICDMKGDRRLYYASNSKHALENAEQSRKGQP